MRNQPYRRGAWQWTNCLDSGVLLHHGVPENSRGVCLCNPLNISTHHPRGLRCRVRHASHQYSRLQRTSRADSPMSLLLVLSLRRRLRLFSRLTVFPDLLWVRSSRNLRSYEMKRSWVTHRPTLFLPLLSVSPNSTSIASSPSAWPRCFSSKPEARLPPILPAWLESVFCWALPRRSDVLRKRSSERMSACSSSGVLLRSILGFLLRPVTLTDTVKFDTR